MQKSHKQRRRFDLEASGPHNRLLLASMEKSG